LTIIKKLITDLSKLPGLGKRSAARIVYYLLKTDKNYLEHLAQDLLELKDTISVCRVCGNYTDVQPCAICTDGARDHTVICVVEEPKDILSMEAIHEYRGLYHVLMGVISPIDGIGPDNLRIQALQERIKKEQIKEVILATNPTLAGDATALYLINLLKKETHIALSRLAMGLPVGGDLEYADKLTLERAFLGRERV
jgi:recombination protein RecR